MFKVLTLSLVFAATAYAAPKTTTAASKSDGSPQVGGAKMAVTNISDGEIAKILTTLNECEVGQAETAKAKSQNEEVRSFADMMITAHQDNSKDTQTVAYDSSINPKDSQISRELKKDSEKMSMSLAKTSPKTFDKFYVNHQVTMHEDALKLLDNKLIPSAKDASLKSHLLKTREAVAGHLVHARELSKKL